jgi:hypothetical protein
LLTLGYILNIALAARSDDTKYQAQILVFDSSGRYVKTMPESLWYVKDHPRAYRIAQIGGIYPARFEVNKFMQLTDIICFFGDDERNFLDRLDVIQTDLESLLRI